MSTLRPFRPSRRLLGLAAALLLAWPSWGPAGSTDREPGPRQPRVAVDDTATARVIVKYRAASTLLRAASAGAAMRPLHAAALGQRLGLVLQDRHVLGARTQSLSASGIGAAELAARIAALPDVEWAEPAKRRVIHAALPNDPYYGPGQTTITPVVGQWYLRAPDTTVKSSVNAIGAWATTTGSSKVTVAVLDTGVRFDHPDLAGKLYPGYDFVSTAAEANDGNGRDADATDPGDYTTAGDVCGGTSSDSSWHGTQTSSLIAAATDNNIGMAGSGRDVMVLPVRVLGKCGGIDDDIQAAMLWAAGLSDSPVVNSHPAQVLNMSLGGSGACEQSYQDLIDQLVAHDVAVVISAGNDTGAAVSSPANCNGAIAVAGLRHIGTKGGFSSLGPEVAISAPMGNCVTTNTCQYTILTAINAGKTTATSSTYSDGTNYEIGTSFSAPLVAGGVALMLSVNPALTLAQIRTALQSTARSFPTSGAGAGVQQCHAPNAATQDECYCTTTTCGAGMLDIGAAVAAVTPVDGAPPTGAITLSSTTPAIGDVVTLGSTGSTAISGRGIKAYAWQLVSGAEHASFVGATNSSTASLRAVSAGSVLVQLTVTDTLDMTNSKIRSVAVQGPAEAQGGGGGGAFSSLWLGLLALAVLALMNAERAERRRLSPSRSERTAR